MRSPRRPAASTKTAPLRVGSLAARLAALNLSVCAIGLGGCSISLPMMSSDSKANVDYAPTGSIAKASAPVATPQVAPLSRKLDVEDWRRARAALATALDPQGNGATVAWDNPQSGRKGSFIPVAAPYPVDGQVCRAFIAKIDAPDSREVVQGSACRVGGTDDWDVRDLKPFQQS